jgi:hypothetical protein
LSKIGKLPLWAGVVTPEQESELDKAKTSIDEKK